MPLEPVMHSCVIGSVLCNNFLQLWPRLLEDWCLDVISCPLPVCLEMPTKRDLGTIHIGCKQYKSFCLLSSALSWLDLLASREHCTGDFSFNFHYLQPFCLTYAWAKFPRLSFCLVPCTVGGRREQSEEISSRNKPKKIFFSCEFHLWLLRTFPCFLLLCVEGSYLYTHLTLNLEYTLLPLTTDPSLRGNKIYLILSQMFFL